MRSHWFLPETPDVLGTLAAQADITVAGITAFAAWAHGDAAQESNVRTAEHGADQVRRELQTQLRHSFSTPIDQEDLYSLSELLDSVMNAAKNIVREADALGIAPDGSAACGGVSPTTADARRSRPAVPSASSWWPTCSSASARRVRDAR